jgi:hypothetical protein
MLPGFRFLFAAIVLSMSAMVFGLGAASLFRAAHEKFASMPSRQGPPVTVFALQTEAAPPALAMLRVEASAVAKPADTIVQGAPATGKPATVATPAEPEISAAAKPEDSAAPSAITKPEIAKPEIAKSEVPVTETSPPAEPVPAQANTPAPAGEPKIAATEPAALPPAAQAAAAASEPVASEPAAAKPTVSELTVSAPAVSEQANQPALPEAASAPATINPKITAKIATLGGPPVAIEREPPAKVEVDNEDNVVKKRQRTRRASHRRHVAARSRLARQTFQPAQQPAIGFAQPAIAVGSR